MMERLERVLISLLTVVVVVLPIVGCDYAAGITANLKMAAELNLPKGNRLNGPELITVLSNATIYASYVYNKTTLVEHFSRYENGYGTFVAQFSEPVSLGSFSTARSFKRRWEINGDLLCTSAINTGKDISCQEVYLKEDTLQFVDPASAAVYLVTTSLEISPEAWEIVNSQNENNMAKKKPLPTITGLASPNKTASSFPSSPVDVQFRSSTPHPNDIAVIIGNADYTEGKDIPNVSPAYADAEGIKNYATQALGISEDNIIFLKDATQTDMIGAFGNKDSHRGRLFRYLTANKSNVFVFYSGHGAPGNGDTNYLVPTDAEASLIDLNGYSLKTLYHNLSKLPAKSVTVVLEACFSGASEAGTVINNASPVYLKAKDTGIPSNITVIAAGAANQIASWETDKSHGLFTKYFLKGMSGEADNDNDREVSWDELRNYFARTVTRSAMRNYGREQTPQIVVGTGG